MAVPAANLEIAEALLHPGPRAGEQSLRPTSDATVRRLSSTNSVGSVVAAWKGTKDGKSPSEPGPSSSFFKKSKHVNVADSNFMNVGGNHVVHHHYHFYSTSPEHELLAEANSSSDFEEHEDLEDISAQPQPTERPIGKEKKRRKIIRAPPLSHPSKSEPSGSLKVQKRLSHEALTPIDQPRVQPPVLDYARLGNLSQPELSIRNRNSLAQISDIDGRAQSSRPRKKIILSTRQVPQVPPPTTHRPTNQDVYIFDSGQQVVNHEYLKNHFWREGRLRTEQAMNILDQATNLFARESNMLSLKSPVTVCGDIHGQYYDLMQIFEVGGSIKNNRYVFLGNYINHGFFGIETVLYLYALKLRYPKQIFLLRGSHECREVAEFFHFRTECLRKYSEDVFEACLRSFWSLPLAALVDDRILCVHGGISPHLDRIENINAIQRFTDSTTDGLLCDLLWSEPFPEYDDARLELAIKQPPTNKQFAVNTNQGRGYYYSYSAVCDFLSRNSLYTIIRGNDIRQSGYNMHRATPNPAFPSVITLFSAPNHLDKQGNLGAILHYKKGSSTIRTYKEKPHPYWLPDFTNVFEWSLPFINTQFTEMLSAIMDINDFDINQENLSAFRPLAERRGIIKKKILAVGRFSRAMHALREQPSDGFPHIAHDSSALGSPPSEKNDAYIERTISKGTATTSRNQSSILYPAPNRQDSAVFEQSTAEDKDPSQTHSMWRKLLPKNDTKTDSEGFASRRSIIQAKIKAIGKWQRLWKSTR